MVGSILVMDDGVKLVSERPASRPVHYFAEYIHLNIILTVANASFINDGIAKNVAQQVASCEAFVRTNEVLDGQHVTTIGMRKYDEVIPAVEEVPSCGRFPTAYEWTFLSYYRTIRRMGIS